MSHNSRSVLPEIRRGARLIFENAEQLYNEAQILGSNGAFSRALCLHQISIEECLKLDMLGAVAMELLLGHAVDLDKFAKAMRQHKAKNYNAAYLSKATEAEKEAWEKGDSETSRRLFSATQKAMHEYLNKNKNASLYVDYRDGKFIAPSEEITEEMAVQMQALNGLLLSHADIAVKLLDRVATESHQVARSANTLMNRLEKVGKSQPGVRPSELLEVIREWIDQNKKGSP